MPSEPLQPKLVNMDLVLEITPGRDGETILWLTVADTSHTTMRVAESYDEVATRLGAIRAKRP